MQIYEFLRLSKENRYQAVWDHGVYVDTYQGSKLTYQLYAVNDFFVEIHYDAQTNKIVGNVPFKHGKLLEKYLPEI